MRPSLPRRIALVFAMMLQAAAPSAFAQAVLYEKSSITCTIRQENVPIEAAFRRFSGQIAFDPAKPEGGKARIDIEVGSFDMGNADVNEMARGRDWFNARDFPRASFVASSMRALGGGRYEARGPFTLKGKTADIAVPFTYRESGGSGLLEGALAIRRLQYGIGEGEWKDTSVLADEVQIRFRLVVAPRTAAK